MIKQYINVIDEQAEFLIVDKPSNLNFHDEDKPGEGLFSLLKAQLGVNELYPVHRLDKMTSGLIIFAKTLAAAQLFQQLFEQHKIEKYYLAVAQGKPKKKQGLIKGDMAKSRRGMWKLARTNVNPAITQFISFNIAPKTRLYLLKPHSGKTHQIRVALNSVGVPITGDPLYNQSSIADRGYLHAFGLTFDLNNRHYEYICSSINGNEFNTESAQKIIMHLTPPWTQSWPTL